MKRILSAIAVMACVAPAPAMSQSAVLPGGYVVGVPTNQPRVGAGAAARQYERDYADRARRENARRNTPERRARAERLAGMASDGRCPEAIVIARAEHDEEMAEQLVEACGVETPTPASQPQ